ISGRSTVPQDNTPVLIPSFYHSAQTRMSLRLATANEKHLERGSALLSYSRVHLRSTTAVRERRYRSGMRAIFPAGHKNSNRVEARISMAPKRSPPRGLR